MATSKSNPKNASGYLQNGFVHASPAIERTNINSNNASSFLQNPFDQFKASNDAASDPIRNSQRTAEEAGRAQQSIYAGNSEKTVEEAARAWLAGGSPWWQKSSKNVDVLTEEEYKQSLVNPKVDSNPLIVYTSDFLPLFDEDISTQAEKLLKAKEVSQLTAAMNAASYVQNKTNFKSSVIPVTKKNIMQLVSHELDDINNYFAAKSRARAILNLKNYKFNVNRVSYLSDKTEEITIAQLVNPENSLRMRAGYYSNTKLWQTLCLMLSTQLQTYSNVLDYTDDQITFFNNKKTNYTPTKEKYIIENVEPYYSKEGDIVAGYVYAARSKFFPDTRVRTLFTSSNNAQLPMWLAKQLLENCLVDTQGKVSSSQILLEFDEKYNKPGLLLAILCTTLSKIRSYSIATKTTFSLTTNNNNEGGSNKFDIFHRIVGNVPTEDVRDFNTIENFENFKNTLMGFCVQDVKTQKGEGYTALFEEDFLVARNNSAIIPGDIYYIDRPSLVKADPTVQQAKNGETLNLVIETSKIKEMSDRAKKHSENFKKVYKMFGLNEKNIDKSKTPLDIFRHLNSKSHGHNKSVYQQFFKFENDTAVVNYDTFGQSKRNSASRWAAMFIAAAANKENIWEKECSLSTYIFMYALLSAGIRYQFNDRENPSNYISATHGSILTGLKDSIVKFLYGTSYGGAPGIQTNSLILSTDSVEGWYNRNTSNHTLVSKINFNEFDTTFSIKDNKIGEVGFENLSDYFRTILNNDSMLNKYGKSLLKEKSAELPSGVQLTANEQLFGQLYDSTIGSITDVKISGDIPIGTIPTLSLADVNNFIYNYESALEDTNNIESTNLAPTNEGDLRAVSPLPEALKAAFDFNRPDLIDEFASEIVRVVFSSNLMKKFVDSFASEVKSSASAFRDSKSFWGEVNQDAYIACLFQLFLKMYGKKSPEELGKVGIRVQFIRSENKDKRYYDIVVNRSMFICSEVKKIEEFNINAVNPDDFSSRYINSGLAYCAEEQKSLLKKVGFVASYLDAVKANFDNLSKKIDADMGTFIRRRERLMKADSALGNSAYGSSNFFDLTNSSADNPSVSNLITNSITEEQLKLTKYILTEMQDRLADDAGVREKLKSAAALTNMPAIMTDITPINDIKLVSHSALSYYFKFEKFGLKRAINSKIMGVGIPHSLVKRITGNVSSFSSNDANKSLVKLKLYKVDHLHPKVVYKPIEMLFDANLFPTRILKNWNMDLFVNDIDDRLGVGNIPLKYFDEKTLEISTIKSRSTSHYEKYYKAAGLTLDQYKDMYNNHAISFLLEEYMTWLTDADFDETRYTRYVPLNQWSDSAVSQYFDIANASTSTASQETIDDTNSAQKKTQISKNITWDSISFSELSSAIKSYFYNETFLLNNEMIKRNILYPKKFDRVFNFIFDPDDFVVDSELTNKDRLQSLVSSGVILEKSSPTGGAVNEKIYTHRNTNENDPQFEEYFVTVEPFTYFQNSLYE